MLRLRIFSLLLALLAVAVLATRVDLGFQRERQSISGPHVVRDGRFFVELPELPALVDRPAAIVVRVRGGQERTDLSVRFDGREIGRATVEPRAVQRIDAAAVPARERRHQLEIVGSTPDWRVRDIEVANVHGFSRGAFSLFILPAERSADSPVPWWVLLPLGIVLVIGRPRSDWPRRRAARVLHRTVATIVLLLLIAILVSGWFTRFQILLALHTAILCVAVLYLERLAAGWARLAPHVVQAARNGYRTTRYGVSHILVIAFFLGCVVQFYAPGYGLTPLIMFGEEFQPLATSEVRRARPFVWRGAGYDGQFYAHLAADPLLQDPETLDALDTAGYRAPRVLFPAIAHVIGLGHTPFVLQIYAGLNIACWLALGWLLLRWLPAGGARHQAAWAACMLSHGLVTSATRSLVDGPSMLLLALSVVAVERGARGLTAGLLGLAVLGRDTNIVAAPILLDRGTRVSSLFAQGLLVVLPLALWLTYLWAIGLTLGQSGSGNFALPLSGYAAEWVASVQGADLAGLRTFVASNLLSMIALTTQVAVLILRPAPGNAWWRMGATYVVLFALLGSPVWEGQPTAATRVLLPMTFAFNVLLPRGRGFWPLVILGNLNVVDALLLLTPWLTGTHLF